MPADLRAPQNPRRPRRRNAASYVCAAPMSRFWKRCARSQCGDLGFDIQHESLDFLTCQHRAAMDPRTMTSTNSAFITSTSSGIGARCNRSTRTASPNGTISAIWPRPAGSANTHGKAMVTPRYASSMSSPTARWASSPCDISMLPTAHNVDSFGFDRRLFGDEGPEGSSWAWLLDRRARGRIALVDEPAIGFFDAALAAEAKGDLTFQDIGNMTVDEIDSLMALLETLRQQGFFVGSWVSPDQAEALCAPTGFPCKVCGRRPIAILVQWRAHSARAFPAKATELGTGARPWRGI